MNLKRNEVKRHEVFIESLYLEKLKHKEHRHKFVIQKIIFTTALFGFGVIKIKNLELSRLLYLVPFVALAFDIYIYSEDFKVKRVGKYITEESKLTCIEERVWEDWLKTHREPMATVASIILTLIIVFGCFIAISMLSPLDLIKKLIYLPIWLVLIFVANIFLIYYVNRLNKKLDYIIGDDIYKRLINIIENTFPFIRSIKKILKDKLMPSK